MPDIVRQLLTCLAFLFFLGLYGCGADVQISARGQSVTSIGVGSR